MKAGDRRLGTAALITGALGIASSAVLNKLAMGAGVHPVWVNVLRLLLTLLIMMPLLLRSKPARAAIKAQGKQDRRLTVLAGVMLALHFATWSASLYYADSLVAVTIWSTFSLMTVVGSSLLLHEKMPMPAVLGIVLATAGVGVCAIGASSSQFLGVVFALCAAITQAIYTLCGRAVRKRMDLLPYTTVVYTVALGCLLVCALVLRIPADGMNLQGIGASLLLAIFCTLGGHSMQNYALRFYKAPIVSAAVMTEVFTGPILVYLIMGEAPKITGVIGGVIILLGVGWAMYYDWRKANGAIPGDGVKAQRSHV